MNELQRRTKPFSLKKAQSLKGYACKKNKKSDMDMEKFEKLKNKMIRQRKSKPLTEAEKQNLIDAMEPAMDNLVCLIQHFRVFLEQAKYDRTAEIVEVCEKCKNLYFCDFDWCRRIAIFNEIAGRTELYSKSKSTKNRQ